MKPYRPSPRVIPELNGLRVLLVFLVSWYHIWQQSWLTPSVGSYSLDYLVRSGYMHVDGTILLSGFLLFLPHARAMLLGEDVPELRSFYRRRVMRIVPSYYFVTLLMLFGVALPWKEYGTNLSLMFRDLISHLTFTQTFDFSTYVGTKIGVASWTIAIEMQMYLLFPLAAKCARRQPVITLLGMLGLAWGFRAVCLTRMSDYNLVVNQLPNFLDVYALGIFAAMVYVKLTTLYPQDRRAYLWQGAATFLTVAAVYGLILTLRAQAACPGTTSIQAGQMMRRPLYASLLTLLMLCLPFAARPLRFLMGNRLMGWLASISLNYYLIHQNLAVHLKRLGLPLTDSLTPHMDGDRAWQYAYTFLCFGWSLALAWLVTRFVEKPAAEALKRYFNKKDKEKEEASLCSSDSPTA